MSATPSLIRPAAPHHRRKLQFAVTSRVEYTVGRLRGEGVTVGCSSDEIVLRTTRSLPVGRKIRLCIDWPAVTDHGALSLVVDGRVLSSTTDNTTAQVLGYKIQARLLQSSAK